MKKKLPKLFYIQENEKTNEYCEKLGLTPNYITEEGDYGDYLVFKKNKNIDAYFEDNLDLLKKKYPKAIFIDLADYLPSEKPKWQPITRGGYQYNIIREDRGDGKMIIEVLYRDIWVVVFCYQDGKLDQDMESEYDLIPYEDPKEEIRKKIEELEKEIKELKKQL